MYNSTQKKFISAMYFNEHTVIVLTNNTFSINKRRPNICRTSRCDLFEEGVKGGRTLCKCGVVSLSMSKCVRGAENSELPTVPHHGTICLLCQNEMSWCGS